MTKPLLALAALVALSGCADKIVSDNHIRDSTALVLNVPASAVTIADRRYDGQLTTYYNASTPQGSYRCTISGGTVNLFGITDPQECSPVQAAVAPAPTVRRTRTRQSASR